MKKATLVVIFIFIVSKPSNESSQGTLVVSSLHTEGKHIFAASLFVATIFAASLFVATNDV